MGCYGSAENDGRRIPGRQWSSVFKRWNGDVCAGDQRRKMDIFTDDSKTDRDDPITVNICSIITKIFRSVQDIQKMIKYFWKEHRKMNEQKMNYEHVLSPIKIGPWHWKQSFFHSCMAVLCDGGRSCKPWIDWMGKGYRKRRSGMY